MTAGRPTDVVLTDELLVGVVGVSFLRLSETMYTCNSCELGSVLEGEATTTRLPGFAPASPGLAANRAGGKLTPAKLLMLLLLLFAAAVLGDKPAGNAVVRVVEAATTVVCCCDGTDFFATVLVVTGNGVIDDCRSAAMATPLTGEELATSSAATALDKRLERLAAG